MKKITAIVRTTVVERIVKSLQEAGIRGISISEVKGIGEQVQVFTTYTAHSRIEIIVPDETVERLTSIIFEYGHTGLAGDGLIAVGPVDYIMKIRTKEKIE